MWFILGNSPFVFTHKRLTQKNQILVYTFVYINKLTQNNKKQDIYVLFSLFLFSLRFECHNLAYVLTKVSLSATN